MVSYISFNVINFGKTNKLYRHVKHRAVVELRKPQPMSAHEFQMVKFEGKYKLVKSENFEEYLKAKGAGFMAIKMATALTPYLEIAHNDDKWAMKVYTMIKTIIDMNFELGKEFCHTRMDGTKCKVVIKIEGNKLIEQETPCDNPEHKQTNVREWIDDDHVVLILKCGDVEAHRYFERV